MLPNKFQVNGPLDQKKKQKKEKRQTALWTGVSERLTKR